MKLFSIKSSTYIYLTLLLLIIPVQWIVSWLIAIFFHEICHWFAVKICRGRVLHFIIGLGGAEMQCSNLSEKCRLLAIMCGPIGGLALACLGKWLPRIALCSFFLSIYNLFPILPFDGGQALRVLLKSNKIFEYIQKMFLLFIILLALFATFYLCLGVLPLAVALGIWLKHRKSPCKEGICRVQ